MTHAHVPGAEEELPVEVGPLDNVHGRNDNPATGAAGEAHHCEVLKQLTTQRTGAHNEETLIGQLILEVRAEHESLLAVSVRLNRNSS